MRNKNLFFINELNFVNKHAGYKARIDVIKCVRECGLNIREKKLDLWGGVTDKIKNIPSFLYFMMFEIKKGDGIIIQYPYPKPFLSFLIKIAKFKRVKLYYIVHDIDIFRGQGSNDKERYFLNSSDLLIVHNDRMIDILKKQGVSSEMITIKIFDYLTNSNNEGIDSSFLNKKDEDINVYFCGNLNKKKSGFIYEWECAPSIKRNVYGINQEENIGDKNCYLGSFDADNPPVIDNNRKSFGLVWDGDSISTCSGEFGSYLKYNNPHKTSLYLSMGLPVIVWSDSAISDFVSDNKLGIKVTSLNELTEILKEMSDDEYETLKKSVELMKDKIIKGHHTQEVLMRINNKFTLQTKG